MALSPNRTSGSMKREKKSQDRKRRMIKRRPKETMNVQVILLAPRAFANANYYKTKLYCHDFTIYSLSNVMSCVTSGMR